MGHPALVTGIEPKAEAGNIADRDKGADVEESWLIAAARKGDQGAFAELYRLHHGYVRGIGRNILRDDSVDDLCQDTFLLAFTRLDSFTGKAQFRAWITRIAVNQCMVILRKRRHSLPLEQDDDLLSRYIFITNDAVLEGAPARMDLEKMMSVLTDLTRQILVMACLEGIPDSEIEEKLGLKAGSVRKRIYCAKRKMRQTFTSVIAS